MLATRLTLTSGNLDLEAGLNAATGLGLGRFNEILLINAAFFALLILALPVLARFGSLAILAVAAAGWLAQPILSVMFLDPPYLLTFVIGVGKDTDLRCFPRSPFWACRTFAWPCPYRDPDPVRLCCWKCCPEPLADDAPFNAVRCDCFNNLFDYLAWAGACRAKQAQ